MSIFSATIYMLHKSVQTLCHQDQVKRWKQWDRKRNKVQGSPHLSPLPFSFPCHWSPIGMHDSSVSFILPKCIVDLGDLIPSLWPNDVICKAVGWWVSHNPVHFSTDSGEQCRMLRTPSVVGFESGFSHLIDWLAKIQSAWWRESGIPFRHRTCKNCFVTRRQYVGLPQPRLFETQVIWEYLAMPSGWVDDAKSGYLHGIMLKHVEALFLLVLSGNCFVFAVF